MRKNDRKKGQRNMIAKIRPKGEKVAENSNKENRNRRKTATGENQ